MPFVLGGAAIYVLWMIGLWLIVYRRHRPMTDQFDRNIAQINANLAVATSNLILVAIFVTATLVIVAVR